MITSQRNITLGIRFQYTHLGSHANIHSMVMIYGYTLFFLSFHKVFRDMYAADFDFITSTKYGILSIIRGWLLRTEPLVNPKHHQVWTIPHPEEKQLDFLGAITAKLPQELFPGDSSSCSQIPSWPLITSASWQSCSCAINPLSTWLMIYLQQKEEYVISELRLYKRWVISWEFYHYFYCL